MRPDYINWSRGSWDHFIYIRLPEVVGFVDSESIVGHQGILPILTWWLATVSVTCSVILRDYRSTSTRIRDHSKSCSFAVLPVSALPGLLFSKPIPCFGTWDGPVLVLLTTRLTRARC